MVLNFHLIHLIFNFFSSLGRREGCEAPNVTMTLSGDYCPRKSAFVAIFMAVYLLVGNVLLINLLIAIFSHVFEEVQANALIIWKYEMWNLITEYDNRPALPPPIICLSHVLLLIRWLVKKRKIEDENGKKQ